ncbi:hypothetical protein ABT124_18035 [Streptomyces sp. NPDC001982]|uniref:hypothetical protein n=1 Tax=Streptomyces sp. NPDC001982 TaxID=3154405 RepID=UPI00332C8695
MSSLHDLASNNTTRYDAQKAAAKAILEAVTEEVANVKAEGGPVDHRAARLRKLAETYALVVHGKAD